MRKLKKKEDGGPGPKAPIVVNNPNDPRLKAYQDSLNLYNGSQNILNQYLKTSKALQTNYPIDLNSHKDLSRDQYIDLRYNNYKQAGLNITRKDIEDDINSVEHTNNKAPSFHVFNYADRNGMAAVDAYSKPVQPYIYQPEQAKRSQVQDVQPIQSIPNVQGSAMIPQAPINPTSNFSFTGRDDAGQQATRYFPDLDQWKAATDQMGYRERSTTNNGQEAHATGYQFKYGGTMKKKDMGGFQPTGPGLAQVATGPASIPDWASNISQGFIHNSANLPQDNPQAPVQPYQGQQMKAQSTDSTIGNPINWGHVLQSNLALGLAQGLANIGPNSQQNAIKRWNNQQFNPMHYLPYTANNSVQDKFGDQSQMKKGGMIKKEDGGYIDADSMRKWIIGDDETPPVVQEAEEQTPQAAQEDDSAQQAAQFNMFIQMFGWDQADQEQEPQEQMKEGGHWIPKHMHKGRCTPLGKPGCPKGSPQYNLAKTFKKHHGFHKKEEGGLVAFEEGGSYDVTDEQMLELQKQGYNFDVI